MGIRKNESYSSSVIVWLALVGATVLTTYRMSLASTITASEVLIDTYKSAPAITPAEAESAIAGLEKVLADCQDNYLAFRIKYSIGVLYFRAHMMEESKTGFIQIANELECPELIRICSFNMIGQISRLKANDREALEAFNKVANLLEKTLSIDSKNTANSTLAKLWCSALFSRAEIYELRKDYTTSIAEYRRLLAVPNQNNEALSRYAPLANDRISQLYLRQADADKYIKLAEALTVDYPEYYRIPIVKLEVECVKFLKSVLVDVEFVNGSFCAPAYTITYLKGLKDRSSAQAVVNKLDRLCKEYPDTYGGILLQYHYAWLLETLGEKEKATEILARISSADVDANDKSWQEAVIGNIQKYAKIQYAIMLGERADYKKALLMLESLRTQPDESHTSELAESVSKSIQILKREVPKNENK